MCLYWASPARYDPRRLKHYRLSEDYMYKQILICLPSPGRHATPSPPLAIILLPCYLRLGDNRDVVRKRNAVHGHRDDRGQGVGGIGVPVASVEPEDLADGGVEVPREVLVRAVRELVGLDGALAGRALADLEHGAGGELLVQGVVLAAAGVHGGLQGRRRDVELVGGHPGDCDE